MKICTKCGVEKALTEFYFRKRRGGQYLSDCKACSKAASKVFRMAHPEAVNAANRKWQAANPEKVRDMKRRNRAENIERELKYEAARRERYQQENPGASTAYAREWKKINAAYVNEYCAARKARRRKATPAWANKFFIEEIYDLAQRRTKATGIEWHVDHIVPLKHPLVQGLHVEHNLRVIPAAENITKGNRYWPDMPGEVNG